MFFEAPHPRPYGPGLPCPPRHSEGLIEQGPRIYHLGRKIALTPAIASFRRIESVLAELQIWPVRTKKTLGSGHAFRHRRSGSQLANPVPWTPVAIVGS